MKKKFVSMLLALCVMLSLVPGSAWAADSDFTIENGVLTKYSGSGGSVVIPDGVTSIGKGAFENCKSLTNITIPDGVTKIGASAFSGCSGLTKFVVPDSVTSIGISAFYGCTKLASAGPIGGEFDYEFGWIDEIPDDAFARCSGLTNITIPDGVTKIGASAFSGCSGLIKITIPNSVTSIGYEAFVGCDGLASAGPIGGEFDYEFGWIDEIPDYAFARCDGLTNITIPDSVTSIGEDAFASCRSLTSITIPNSVTSIGESAFSLCSSLVSITIPDGVTIIDNHVFWCCESLENIVIPNGVTRIGTHAFRNCRSLTSIAIPNSVTDIDGSAFQGCSSLTSITIPNTVTRISSYAFYECSGLTGITIPESVTKIDNVAFYGCSSLKDVYYSGNESQWQHISISAYADGNSCLTNATIHYNSTGPEKKEYKIYRNGGYEVFDVSLEQCMAKASSTEYNPQLAHMLITMCNSVFSNTEMEATFKAFGFESTYRADLLSLTYSMAKKQLPNGETLLLIVARGTEDIEEWISNLNAAANENGQHSGFANATKDVYSSAKDFLKTSDFSNVKFVITGFSRGAAVSNLLATRLLDENVNPDKVFAYTFACPDTAVITSEKVSRERYKCIFNIANANDFVSWVPRVIWASSGEKDGWGKNSYWDKYGQSYWYSNVWNNYKDLEMGLDAHNQAKYLDYLRAEKSSVEYLQREAAKEKLDNAVMKRELDTRHQNIGGRRVPYIRVHCPVDVEIYSSDNQTVASVVDNVVNTALDEKVYIYVSEEQKNIFLLEDDIYTFRLSGTDDGTMTYSVQNIDVSTWEITEEKVFENVALTDKKEMTSYIGVENTVDVQEVQLYVLNSSDEPAKEVLPDGNGTEVPLKAYTITFDATSGTVSTSTLTTSIIGQLSALPTATRNGYTFNGWYLDDGTQVTTKTVFRADTTVKAKWTATGGGSSGGGGGGSVNPSLPTYSIVVPSAENGTVKIDPISASKGDTVSVVINPNDGYRLLSLTVSNAHGTVLKVTNQGGGKYTFVMPDSEVTVNAVFQEGEAWKNPFTDVSEGAWYYDAVKFVSENGLMNGVGNNAFAPNIALSRAMLMQILYNKEDKPAVTSSSVFTDVASDTWYSSSVCWAAEQNIITGYGNGLFGPTDSITREQLAVILWRYAEKPEVTDRALPFDDVGLISEYAQEALCWARENKIINGKGSGILDPQGKATRAEVAQMLMNYLAG